jgi:hypothetical protein
MEMVSVIPFKLFYHNDSYIKSRMMMMMMMMMIMIIIIII